MKVAAVVRIGLLPVLAAALALVLWVRVDPLSRDTIWAEDGRDFLQGALDGAGWFTPYAGYQHLVPRMVAAAVVALAPVSGFAVAITAGATLIAGMIGALVYACSATTPLSRPARLALATITVAAPAATVEVSGNLGNLHWLLLWLSPWLFLAKPRSWWSSAVLAVVTFLVTATEIQSLVFAPLLLFGWRSRMRWPLRATAVAGLSLQIATTLLFPRATAPRSHPSAMTVWDGYLLQAVDAAWLHPLARITALIAEQGWWVAAALAIPFAVSLVGVVAASRRTRWLALMLALTSAILWTLGFVANASIDFDWAHWAVGRIPSIGSSRYGVVPSMLVLAVVVIAVDRLLSSSSAVRGGAAVVRIVAGCALIALIGSAVLSSQDAAGLTRRSQGPSWSQGVTTAAATCTTDAGSRRIATAPDRPMWAVRVPCSLLRASTN